MKYYTEYPTNEFDANSDTAALTLSSARVIYRESDTPDGSPFIMLRDDPGYTMTEGEKKIREEMEEEFGVIWYTCIHHIIGDMVTKVQSTPIYYWPLINFLKFVTRMPD